MPPTRYHQHTTLEPTALDNSNINDELDIFPPLQDLVDVKTVARVDLPAVTSVAPIFVTITQASIATVTATVTIHRTVLAIAPSMTALITGAAVPGLNTLAHTNQTTTSSGPPSIASTNLIGTSIDIAPASSSTATSSFPSLPTPALPLAASSISTPLPTSSPSSSPFLTSVSSTPSSLPKLASLPTTVVETTPEPPASSFIPAPTVSTSSSSDNENNTLSTGGIAGLTIVIVVIFLLATVFLIRQRLRKKREKKGAWVTPFVSTRPAVRVSVNERQKKRMEFLAERWERMRSRRRRNRAAQGGTESGGATSGSSMGQRSRDYRLASRPPGEPLPPLPTHIAPSGRRPVGDSLSFFPNGAVSRLDFEPDRPDELRVRAGDILKVIALYDDGWAQCKNSAGEKGMVPTTCLRINDIARRR